ncbi:MAG: DMT family transporter, partial [Phycisphaerae bacterium]
MGLRAPVPNARQHSRSSPDRSSAATDVTRPTLLPVAVAVGVLSISTAAVLIKRCDDAPTTVIAAARLGIAALVLLPAAATRFTRRGGTLQRRYIGHIVLAGALLAAHFYCWILSLKHTSVMSSVVIVTTNPIFIGVMSYWLFGERVNRYLVGAIVLAGAGGVLIAVSDAHAGADAASDPLYGNLLALVGAVMASCYFLVGRRLRREVHIVAYITPVYAVAAVILLAAALVAGHGFSGYRPATYAYFVALAIVPQILGHGLLNWSLRYITATTVSVFILGEPIGATVLAYFVLGETVAPLQVCGGALTLAGILLAARKAAIS